MKKIAKKLLSVVVALATVTTMSGFNNVGAADYTVEQMIRMLGYNVALGSNITANPSLQEGSTSYLSDGELTPHGNHAATTFGTPNTYYLVDLGAVYDASTIDKLAVGYKEKNDGDNPVNGYEIYYSANGLDYTKVKTITGAQVTSQITEENPFEVEDLSGIEGKVRFVKILYKNACTWGIQATEIALISSEGNAQTVEPDICSDAESVDVKVEDFNTISYKITASEGQTGYKYLVYAVKGTKETMIGNGVDADTEYTVDNLTDGTYKVKVVSCYDGCASAGIFSESFIVDDVSSAIDNVKNIANRAYGYPAQISEAKFYEGHSISTANVALDGKLKTGEGSDSCLRVASGGNQAVVVDLGEYYTPSEIDYVLTAHTNTATCPSDVKVEFSQDGLAFTTVGNKTGYAFSAANNSCGINRINLKNKDEYTKSAVRFVKLTFNGGGNGWGYCINEIAVVANTDEPTIVGSNIVDPAEVFVYQDKLASISYEIVAAEGQEDATFVVSLDGAVIDNNAEAGKEYTIDNVSVGKHTVSVSTFEDGWLSKGIKREYQVAGYRNYIDTALNVAHKDYYDAVASTDSDNIRTDDWTPIGQDISAGVKVVNNGLYLDSGHHTGYLQTRSDSKIATVDIDLGQSYDPSELKTVISVFNDAYTAATAYEIFMSGDGENFESVYKTDNAKYEDFMEAPLDFKHYSQETVRYVKYKMTDGPFAPYYKEDGSKNWEAIGYLVREIAVMREDSVLPDKVENVQVTSTEDNIIDLSFDLSDNPDYGYVVYVDGIPSGHYGNDIDGKLQFKVSGGTHTVRVATTYNGFEGLGKEFSVFVKEAPTTQAPTTVRPTNKPTTKAPTTVAPTKVTPTKQPITLTPTEATQADKPVTAPGKTAVKKAVKKKSAKNLSVTLKKVTGAKGYTIAVYKTKANANKNKKAIVKKNVKKATATIKSSKFKNLKTMFVRARAYKVDAWDDKVPGKWSAVKKVTIK